jgi:uncharacterized repeat protein (TIGR03803 family)
LVVSSNVLYGVVIGGGYSPTGSVFSLSIDGSGFKNLHNYLLRDETPVNGLTMLGGTLYGTTWSGSTSGTVFSLNADGTRYAVVHNFVVGNTNSAGVYTNADGINPTSVLLLAGNTLYGTTRNGGSSGYGTIFSISLPPQLTLTPAGPSLVLSWSTNFSGFSLQSTPDLTSAAWTTNFPAPVVVNGEYTVTNPISGPQQFFRLRQ